MPNSQRMMKVVQNAVIGNQVQEIVLEAPEAAAAAVPGQFLHVKVSDQSVPLLRRPISISGADVAAGTIKMIYRIIGPGTQQLAKAQAGDSLDCMGPLGRGFSLDAERPLLVGGGVGLAPLLFLAERLCPHPIQVLMGGRTQEDLFWETLFEHACEEIHITTDDGSRGRKGFTVDLLPELIASGRFDKIYTCGPRPMMEGVARIAQANHIPCEVSLEEYMACGVGACLSCTCAGQTGKRRKVCTEGPVFDAQEVMPV